MNDAEPVRPGQLILAPALITLGVTLLRLVGELQGWSPLLFSKAAGGGGALVGISWLVLLFGAWFGWKLARAGQGPGPIGRALGLAILAFALLPIVGFAARALGMSDAEPQHVRRLRDRLARGPRGGASGLAGARPHAAPYAFAARVPVALVALSPFSATGARTTTWCPPDFPAMAPLQKWLLIGLLPQMTIWIWFTVAVGSIFGIVAGAIARRGRATA